MKTNEEIFETVRENGYITEQEINLLKRRSNDERPGFWILPKRLQKEYLTTQHTNNDETKQNRN